MMEEFKKMLMEKAAKQGPTDDKKMSAKAMVMKELSDMLGEGMKGDMVDGLKKITVASNTPEGLETGIDLAKKKIADLKGESEEESSEEESEESPEEQMSEDESAEDHEASEEDDSEIAELEKKLAELKAKKMK